MSNIPQKVILALDLGEKRTGLAVSHGIVAAPAGFLDIGKKTEFFDELNSLISAQGVNLLVVGLPLDREGRETKQSLWVRKQVEQIEEEISLPVEFVEESFTSHDARDILGKAKQKGEIDAYSAVSILERYLSER